MRTHRLFPLLSLVALAAGCAPSLDFDVFEPPRHNLGPGRQLTVLQTEGRQGPREFLVSEMGNEAREENFFRVVDRSYEGMVIQRTGNQVTVYNSRPPAPQAFEVGVRMDLLDWVSLGERATREVRDSNGNVTVVEEFTYRGRVAFMPLLFDPSGRVLLADVEYGAESSGRDEEQVMREAAEGALQRFLADITPRRVRASVRLDMGDSAQEGMLDLAQRGSLQAAVEQMQGYVAANPGNAAAHYNLGAMLEASLRFREALDSYDRAIGLNAQSLYTQTRSDCARRLAHAQSLGM
jgi:hypothetical protein